MDYIYLGLIITFFPIFLILITGKINYFSPLMIHCISWFAVFLTGVFISKDFFPIKLNIFIIFLVWYFPIVLILLILQISHKQKIKENHKNSNYIIKKQFFLIIICILSSFITVYETYKVGVDGPYNFALNIRFAQTYAEYEGKKFLLNNYLYLIMTPIFAISLLAKKNLMLKILSSLWQILFIISTMGKFAILTPLLIYLIINYWGFKKKFNVINIISFLTLFYLISFLLQYYRIGENGEGANSVSAGLAAYIYLPIVALGQIEPASSELLGMFTFRFFYAVTYAFGLNNSPPIQTILDYTYIPVPFNVYTVMQPFYSDFGVLGVLLGSFFYGLLFGVLYLKAITKEGLFLIIYSMLSVNLLTSFFAETLITNFALNLIYLPLSASIVWRLHVTKS